MRTMHYRLLAFLATVYLLIPDWVLAAGPAAKELIVVADTRRVSWGPELYLVNLYNTNPTRFGIWCLVLTLIWGGTLGFVTDFFMKRTGIDLESREIIEH
jgi:hypothetical protein